MQWVKQEISLRNIASLLLCGKDILFDDPFPPENKLGCCEVESHLYKTMKLLYIFSDITGYQTRDNSVP